jgi:hypothetical protein
VSGEPAEPILACVAKVEDFLCGSTVINRIMVATILNGYRVQALQRQQTERP